MYYIILNTNDIVEWAGDAVSVDDAIQQFNLQCHVDDITIRVERFSDMDLGMDSADDVRLIVDTFRALGADVTNRDCIVIDHALTVYWDDSDPDNQGWAYRYDGDSGPLDTLQDVILALDNARAGQYQCSQENPCFQDYCVRCRTFPSGTGG